MKTQARSAWAAFIDLGTEERTGVALTERFTTRGFTVEQARLKAVWEDPQIASICSHMPSITFLRANIAAAVDRISLSGADKRMMERYATETRTQYCV